MGLIVTIKPPASKAERPQIDVSGEEVKDCKWEDLKAMGIYHSLIMNGVQKRMGRKPKSYAWSRHHGDETCRKLFPRYGFSKDVRLHTRGVKGRVMSNITKPLAISEIMFDNEHSDIPLPATAGIQHSVTEGMSIGWDVSVSTSLSQKVTYKGTLPGGEIGGENEFKVTTTIGVNGNHSESRTLAANVGASPVIPPGRLGALVLSAQRGKLHLQAHFDQTLDGGIWVDYGEKKYRGHHFYYFNLRDILPADKRRRSYIGDIKFDFYADAKAAFSMFPARPKTPMAAMGGSL